MKVYFSATMSTLSVIYAMTCSVNCAAQNLAHATKIFRLVSFAPSCTELVESINAKNSLVGICKFCQAPAKPSIEVERVGDFNTANIERLARLKPDMVLVVTGQDALIQTLKNNKFAVTTFPNSSLADISKKFTGAWEVDQPRAGCRTKSTTIRSSNQRVKGDMRRSRAPSVCIFLCLAATSPHSGEIQLLK